MRCLAVVAAALLLGNGAPAHRLQQPEIAITIDDLPVHAPYPPGVTPLAVNRRMIAALTAAHVPVTAFVNAVNVKRPRHAGSTSRVAHRRLHAWQPYMVASAPQRLDHCAVRKRADEGRADALEARGGRRLALVSLSLPRRRQGFSAAQAARRVLARHGYRIAAVTMSFSDWAFTGAYARCSAAHNTAQIAELERLYLQSAREKLAASRDNARKLYGRDIPYVLLMHVSAMSARMMPQVIRLYREAGFRLVSLPQAERDPSLSRRTRTLACRRRRRP